VPAHRAELRADGELAPLVLARPRVERRGALEVEIYRERTEAQRRDQMARARVGAHHRHVLALLVSRATSPAWGWTNPEQALAS
jgi:hypothetical protein